MPIKFTASDGYSYLDGWRILSVPAFGAKPRVHGALTRAILTAAERAAKQWNGKTPLDEFAADVPYDLGEALNYDAELIDNHANRGDAITVELYMAGIRRAFDLRHKDLRLRNALDELQRRTHVLVPDLEKLLLLPRGALHRRQVAEPVVLAVELLARDPVGLEVLRQQRDYFFGG